MQTKMQLMAAYAKRLTELNNNAAICEGYYKVMQIINQDATKSYIALKVTACWRPTDKVLKEVSYNIDINLNCLFNRHSIGPKEVHLADLEGATIHVKSVDVVDYEWDGQKKTTVKVDWSILSFGDKENK